MYGNGGYWEKGLRTLAGDCMEDTCSRALPDLYHHLYNLYHLNLTFLPRGRLPCP